MPAILGLTDRSKELEGIEVPYITEENPNDPDPSYFTLARIGTDQFKEAVFKARKAYKRTHGGEDPTPGDDDQLNIDVLSNIVVLGWRNVVQYDEGTDSLVPLEYSKQNCRRLLDQERNIVNFIIDEATKSVNYENDAAKKLLAQWGTKSEPAVPRKRGNSTHSTA